MDVCASHWLPVDVCGKSSRFPLSQTDGGVLTPPDILRTSISSLNFFEHALKARHSDKMMDMCEAQEMFLVLREAAQQYPEAASRNKTEKRTTKRIGVGIGCMQGGDGGCNALCTLGGSALLACFSFDS